MATKENKAQPETKKIVPFRPKREEFITQTDLIEEILLWLKARKARLERQKKRAWIRQQLERNIPVEDGPHSAELIKRRRGAGYIELVVH